MLWLEQIRTEIGIISFVSVLSICSVLLAADKYETAGNSDIARL